MKKVFLVSAFLLAVLVLQATHITHGNMYYQYVGTESNGNYRYKITLLVLRDCAASQVQFDNTVVLGVYANGFSGYALEQSLSVNLKSETSVNPIGIAPAMGSPLCIRRAVYETEVVLSNYVSDYYIALTRCCHSQMNNILDADQNGNLFHVQIPIATAPQNSSPATTNESVLLMGVGITTTISLAEDDYDSDSLTYSLTPLLIDGSNDNPAPLPTPTLTLPFKQAAYRTNYSSVNVLGNSPSFISLNHTTGTLVAHPSTSGRYLMAYTINEWRNGAIINNYYREKEVLVIAFYPSLYNNINLMAKAAPVAQKKINLNWTHNLQKNDSGILVVQRRIIRTNNWATIATLDSTALTYTDTSIHYDSFYVYRVMAYYDTYQKAVSNSDSAFVRKNTVGLNNITPLAAITVYPNPTQGILYINTTGQTINSITIINTLGQTVKNIPPTYYNGAIDVTALPTGIYFIEINCSDKSQTIKKFIKN
jgi:hypothetical protein